MELAITKSEFMTTIFTHIDFLVRQEDSKKDIKKSVRQPLWKRQRDTGRMTVRTYERIGLHRKVISTENLSCALKVLCKQVKPDLESCKTLSRIKVSHV